MADAPLDTNDRESGIDAKPETVTMSEIRPLGFDGLAAA